MQRKLEQLPFTPPFSAKKVTFNKCLYTKKRPELIIILKIAENSTDIFQ